MDKHTPAAAALRFLLPVLQLDAAAVAARNQLYTHFICVIWRDGSRSDTPMAHLFINRKSIEHVPLSRAAIGSTHTSHHIVCTQPSTTHSHTLAIVKRVCVVPSQTVCIYDGRTGPASRSRVDLFRRFLALRQHNQPSSHMCEISAEHAH